MHTSAANRNVKVLGLNEICGMARMWFWPSSLSHEHVVR